MQARGHTLINPALLLLSPSLFPPASLPLLFLFASPSSPPSSMSRLLLMVRG